MFSGVGGGNKKDKEIHNILRSDEQDRGEKKQGKVEKDCQIRRAAFYLLT